MQPIRITRLAPSPTGALHLGNARTFLFNWLLARGQNWRIILRIEDLDGPRVKIGAGQQAISDLQWLGLSWDEGPVYQSARTSQYQSAIGQLLAKGLAYPCTCSRREVESASSAPHAEDQSSVYPGTCRGKYASVEQARDATGKEPAIRFRVPSRIIEFADQFKGPQHIDAERLGDFVIAKNDGTAAYQLAVVVDDAEMNVTEVVRGDDLLDSAARQILLYEALGLGRQIPNWYHLPLVIGTDGRRLAKRHGDTRISHYREQGVSAERILGLLGNWCGIDCPREARLTELLQAFELEKVPREKIIIEPGRHLMERAFLDICAGRRRGPGAAMARAVLRVAEVPYRWATALRNLSYDRGILRSRELPRKTISIGNLTTGGTGKTPVVSWLTANLLAAGRHPAILMRGYKGTDEQIVLSAANPGCGVVANPNRVEGAQIALANSADIDDFILDDAMQHRRVRRDMEIVLVNAREPWGFGHVLPRGLLRESPAGLRRAGAIVVTHATEIAPAGLNEIESTIRRHIASAPIFYADHVLTGLEPFDGSQRLPMSALNGKKYFVACGIASPESFISLLAAHGGQLAGKRFFADHHPFTEQEAAALERDADACGADMVIVTRKDWAKLKDFQTAKSFLSAGLEIRFAGGHGEQLLDLVLQRITA